jgi:hypothetical protein
LNGKKKLWMQRKQEKIFKNLKELNTTTGGVEASYEAYKGKKITGT